MDDATDIDRDRSDEAEALYKPSARLREAIRRECASTGGERIIAPVDEAAYQAAIEGLIALGGKDPTAKAPPRRRFR